MSEVTKRLQIVKPASDWSVNDPTDPGYVKNRTHWEESPEIDIIYDGNAWDQYFVYNEEDQIWYVKLSDHLPTVEALTKTTVTVTRNSGSENETKTVEQAIVWHEYSNDIGTLISSSKKDTMAFVIREPNYTFLGETFEETGVYVMMAGNTFISEIHIPAIRHRLDGKYLPEGTPWVERLGETVLLPETAVNVDGSMTQLSNLIGLAEGEKYRVTCRGVDYECVCKAFEDLYEGMPAFAYYIGNGSLMDYASDSSYGLENTGEPFIIADFLNVKYAETACIAMNQTMMGVQYPQEGDTLSVTHIAREFHDIPEKNRTHWAEKVDVPLDIRLDKSKMLYYYCPDGGGVPQTWVHLSDRVLTVDELAGCTLRLADGNTIDLGDITAEATDYGTTFEITSDDYVDYAIRIVEMPDALAPDAKPGVYFKVETNTPDKQVMRLYSDTVTMPGVKYHKLPPEYAPEIPTFDLVEMGLPTIITDTAGTGECVLLEDVDFTEFENALKKGPVKVRVAIQMAETLGYATSVCMPTHLGNENLEFWQLTAVAVPSFDDPSLRIVILYHPATSSEKARMYGHCAMLQHFTMT